jgi:uncharacterized membrane-anchored protein
VDNTQIGLSKVAVVNFAFWVMKVCATTVGETGGDMLSMTLNVGYAISSVILVSFFLVALFLQLRSKEFNPYLYWGVILATSTAGTTISDFMDRTLKLGYTTGSLVLVSILAIVLMVWRYSCGTISVDHIRTPKMEGFYWAAILVSNTLGTALGDFLADSSGLGFLKSNLLISGSIGVIVVCHFFTKIPKTILFWGAFVLTRPFGATLGDLLTKTPDKGGLGFGTIGSSAVLVTILMIVIIWDTQRTKQMSKSA